MILTKCVSAADKELDGHNPLADVHYNVEHTFAPLQSLIPAWCMHCGKFGRKDFLRCRKCDNTCHQKCTHNIPNHCGMPRSLPELAALRLSGLKIAAPQVETTSQTGKIGDYEILKLLGKGNFGQVVLAKQKPSGTIVAIKAIKKATVLENDELENIETERQVFLVSKLEAHPFLVQLLDYFVDEENFYFVMEYLAGGDLMFHIQKRRFTEEDARLYAAEVFLAIEYLHKHNIIYRYRKSSLVLQSPSGVGI